MGVPPGGLCIAVMAFFFSNLAALKKITVRGTAILLISVKKRKTFLHVTLLGINSVGERFYSHPFNGYQALREKSNQRILL